MILPRTDLGIGACFSPSSWSLPSLGTWPPCPRLADAGLARNPPGVVGTQASGPECLVEGPLRRGKVLDSAHEVGPVITSFLHRGHERAELKAA